MSTTITALQAAADALGKEIEAHTAKHPLHSLYTSLREAIKQERISIARRRGAVATNKVRKAKKEASLAPTNEPQKIAIHAPVELTKEAISVPLKRYERSTCIDCGESCKNLRCNSCNAKLQAENNKKSENKCPDCDGFSATGKKCKYCVAKMAVAARQESRKKEQMADTRIPATEEIKTLNKSFDKIEQLETRNPVSSETAGNNHQVASPVHKVTSYDEQVAISNENMMDKIKRLKREGCTLERIIQILQPKTDGSKKTIENMHKRVCVYGAGA